MKRQMLHTHPRARAHKPICIFHDVIVFWNNGVQTDREVLAYNWKREMAFVLLVVAIAADRYFMYEEAEYKEIQGPCTKDNECGT